MKQLHDIRSLLNYSYNSFIGVPANPLSILKSNYLQTTKLTLLHK